ncbi:MAG: DUF29 domain-containing protein [Woronichinia naegeliana WA131]|uniref:DUF29 domain-containing protein n=1 Tax=Woronichinia naegeliana WA131 TaxID=2824559 RepID=A0A977KVQ9_9CYAN|nr:MAG: DUF29 domain-containing protein [Woronichinia naegeliana WA131]
MDVLFRCASTDSEHYHIVDCYKKARLDAATETKLPLKTFPLECPFTEEQILTAGWFPNP